MDTKIFDWFQLDIEKQLGKIEVLVAKHTPHNADATYLGKVHNDLDRVIKTIEEHHG